MRSLVVVLTVSGGLLALVAITIASLRATRLRWRDEQVLELTDLAGMYQAHLDGPGSAAAIAQAERAEQYKLLTGRELGQPEPEVTLRDVVAAEFGLPAILGAASVVVSTVASLLSLNI